MRRMSFPCTGCPVLPQVHKKLINLAPHANRAVHKRRARVYKALHSCEARAKYWHWLEQAGILFFRSYCKVCWTVVFRILVLPSIILQLTWRSFLKTYFTCTMFSNIFVIVNLPLLPSMLLVNSSWHRNVLARGTADPLNTFWMFHTFSLYYNQVSHKTELYHVDLNFFHDSYYMKAQAILYITRGCTLK